MSLCFTRLSATVCEFLSVLWFSRFRPEVVSGTRGRGKPEVTSPFDSSTHFCISGLLTFFVYLFPFKSYSTFSFRLEIPIGAEILGVLGILDPLVHAHINETPKGTSLRQTASFEPSCMFVRRSVRPLRDCEKKIQKKRKLKIKRKSHKVVIFHVCVGRPYPTDCNGSLHICLGHQRNQSCQFMWL
jgi:hypothetical protein